MELFDSADRSADVVILNETAQNSQWEEEDAETPKWIRYLPRTRQASSSSSSSKVVKSSSRPSLKPTTFTTDVADKGKIKATASKRLRVSHFSGAGLGGKGAPPSAAGEGGGGGAAHVRTNHADGAASRLQRRKDRGKANIDEAMQLFSFSSL